MTSQWVERTWIHTGGYGRFRGNGLKNFFYLIYFIDTFLVGKSSNFAIVVARLIVDAKDHGIQMFIVQLRDLNTHQPLPGVFCNIFYIVL